MNWALVNQRGKALGDGGGAYSSAMRSILSRLPADVHNELWTLLDEACTQKMRRRLSVTLPDQPLVVVDIFPLDVGVAEVQPALVVLNDGSEMDGTLGRWQSLARRNEAILRSAMDGFFVVDADCRFLEANEAFCRMVGYLPAELRRMRITDLEVTEAPRFGLPSYTRTGLHSFPTAHRHKDGHIVHLEISANVLHDDGVKILVGLARDVTERVAAEEQLARLTRQQQLILGSAAEGIIGLDREGNVTLVNPAAARILGTTPDKLVGRQAHDTFFPPHAAESGNGNAPCILCACLQERNAEHQDDATFSRMDGTKFPAEFSISSLRDEAADVGAVLIFRDMTERRRADRERQELQAQVERSRALESLGFLAGGIAHNLNNTLAGVQGHASLALPRAGDQGEVPDRLRNIIKACERASGVIRQVLNYSGQMACDAEPIDCNRFVREVGEFVAATVPRHIRLSIRTVDGLPAAAMDGGLIEQALMSVVKNAIEAIGDRIGEITLLTEALELSRADVGAFIGQELMPGRYVAIHVDDNGPGMDPAASARVFEPFFSSKGTGRGLGLAAVLGIMRAHGGGARLRSGIGRGTRISLLLPVAGAATPQPELEPVTTGRPATVLVVDDEEEVRDVIRDMLATHGFDVLLAPDGEEALRLFSGRGDGVELVILDMTMPGMSGADVLREMRAVQPDVKVVIVSGYSVEQNEGRLRAHAPNAYLAKPFTMDALLETVWDVLGRDGVHELPRRPAERVP